MLRFEGTNEATKELEPEERVAVINMRIERSASSESHYESDDESKAKSRDKFKRSLTRREYKRLRTQGGSPGRKSIHPSISNNLTTVLSEEPREGPTAVEVQPLTAEEEAKKPQELPSEPSVTVTETELEEVPVGKR